MGKKLACISDFVFIYFIKFYLFYFFLGGGRLVLLHYTLELKWMRRFGDLYHLIYPKFQLFCIRVHNVYYVSVNIHRVNCHERTFFFFLIYVKFGINCYFLCFTYSQEIIQTLQCCITALEILCTSFYLYQNQ